MKSNPEIIKQFKKHKGVSERGLADQFKNTEKCYQYFEANFFDTSKANRKPVQIDKVSPYINAVNGFMIQNRPVIKYAARTQDEQAQEFYSKNANAVAKYVRKNARADQVDTQANKKTLMIGYSATETAMTYSEGYATTDPNGEIIMGDVTDDVIWDPMARKTNLVDSRWAAYRKSYSLEDAKTLFSTNEDEDFQDAPHDRETGYTFDPDIYPYDRYKMSEATEYDWNNKSEKTVWVYFYQWYEVEDFYRAENPVYKLTNPVAIQAAMEFMDNLAIESEQDDSMFNFDPSAERLVFDSSTKAKLEEQFEDLLKTYKFQRKVFYTAVLSGDKVFTSYRSVSQQGFTIKFITGTWYQNSRMWVGMINPMMEPVLFFNKSLEALMYTIDANSKGGLLYEESATDNPVALEANYNKTDRSIMLNEGGLNKVREKRSPFQPTGYENVITLSDKAISDTMGFDLAAILSQEGQNGVLHRQLVKQVKSTLAANFDSFESYREEHSRLLLDYMKVYAENNEGGIVRIIGEDNVAEFITLSKDAFFAEYDIDVQEAPESDEEKQEQAQILFSVGDKLAAIGDPSAKAFYAGGLKVMPLDTEQRREMLEALQPAEDPRVAALQQQVQQLTSEANQAQLRLINAQTALTQSTVDKNMADVQSKAAGITKTLEETNRITIENNLARLATPENVSVSI